MERSHQLRESVRRAYSEAALHPEGEHPFPIGRHFAESIGYPTGILSRLPSVCVESFSGVSNVAISANLPIGATILDLGCGAGLDSLIAGMRVGSRGRVVGVDFSDVMLVRARQAAAECRVDNVEFCRADAERLPIIRSSIDVCLVNGIFNLNPERDAIFRELARVVRDGGMVCAAELVVRESLPLEIQNSESNWFA